MIISHQSPEECGTFHLGQIITIFGLKFGGIIESIMKSHFLFKATSTPPHSQLFSFMTNTIEKDMFLVVLAYQSHICGFDMLEQREICLFQWY